MPSIKPLELAVVLVVVLVVFGPKRRPELGRSMGQGIREFKGSLSARTPVGRTDEPFDSPSSSGKSPPRADDRREGREEH